MLLNALFYVPMTIVTILILVCVVLCVVRIRYVENFAYIHREAWRRNQEDTNLDWYRGAAKHLWLLLFAKKVDVDVSFLNKYITTGSLTNLRETNVVYFKHYFVNSTACDYVEIRTNEWFLTKSPVLPHMSMRSMPPGEWHKTVTKDYFVYGDVEQFEEDIMKMALFI
jgi:hypothetical protein